jgi:DNA polymerase
MECKLCDLHKTRGHIVNGHGNPEAEIMFIGEAPGYYENLLAKPFVGNAGKVLNELLSHINISRDDVYITNIVKCRPPNNRDPTQEEIDKCTRFLEAELDTVAPRIIVPLGRFATKYIVERFGQEFTSIGKMHGVPIPIGGITIVPMYHPAYAVHDPTKKDILINDFENI